MYIISNVRITIGARSGKGTNESQVVSNSIALV